MKKCGEIGRGGKGAEIGGMQSWLVNNHYDIVVTYIITEEDILEY
jgi:hypothetical protein